MIVVGSGAMVFCALGLIRMLLFVLSWFGDWYFYGFVGFVACCGCCFALGDLRVGRLLVWVWLWFVLC